MNENDNCSIQGFNELIGKTISDLKLIDEINEEENDDEITPNYLHFVFSDGTKVKMFDKKTCCESRYMRTDDNLEDFIGSQLIDIEIADASKKETEDINIHEIQFLRIKTSNGVLVISNHNIHNGYYEGFDIRFLIE